MFKRIGILALMLSASGAVLLPTIASAQQGYYGSGNSYDRSDRNDARAWRDSDRHEVREFRERERWDRRAEEQRERAARRYEWRAESWRDQDNRYRYDRYSRQGFYCPPDYRR